MAISGLMSVEETYDYLRPLAIAVLSTVSPAGEPYAATIFFITDQDLNFYFLTKSDTKKSEYLEETKKAALTIIDPSSPKTVQATGTVSEIETPQMYQALMAKIAESNVKETGFYWPPPLSKLDSSGDLLLYQFTPEWLRVADFSEDPKEGNTFYQVLPITS